MPVTSTTVAGVNCFQFSGSVTDAEIKTAWASAISSGVYILNRAIYLDSTADISGVLGGYLVDFGTQVLPGIILHASRNKSKSTFKNFVFYQRVGLAVANRTKFVQSTDGTTLSVINGVLADGLSMLGGSFVYAVAGNSGTGDSRYLNELAFASLDGATLMSQQFTEQELQPVIGSSTQIKGLSFQKAFGFPQVDNTSIASDIQVAVYRCNLNTEHASQLILRAMPTFSTYSISLCYIDSYCTRQGNDVSSNLFDTYGSNGTRKATVVIFNNYTRESFFGAAKTALAGANWNAANQFIGGRLFKLQFVGGAGTVRCYDSRSTTTSQRCAFVETGSLDFLSASTAPSVDAQGRIAFGLIGAIATGGSATSVPITRYTGQRYVYQEFGKRVIVTDIDVTLSGANDLSPYVPMTLTAQLGITRSQSAIQAATSINSLDQLLEELHNLAVTQQGAQSYGAAYGGNLFSLDGTTLKTGFSSVLVDAFAAQKINYNHLGNTLTIKSAVLASGTYAQEWVNASGTITTANNAVINSVYSDSSGTSSVLSVTGLVASSVAVVNSAGAIHVLVVNQTGSKNFYFSRGQTGKWQVIAERYGYKRQTFFFTPEVGGVFAFSPIWIPDATLTETSSEVTAAYTELTTQDKTLDRIAYERTTSELVLTDKVFKDGTYLNWGDANLQFVSSAPDPLTYNPSTNTFTVVTGSTRSAGVLMQGDKTAGIITHASDVTIASAYEDAMGVRVTIRKSDGKPFNIVARRGTSGSYTDLGYRENVASVTYTVPKGPPVEAAMWSVGDVTYTRIIDTSQGSVNFSADMTPNASINTAIDVSAYLANISTSLDTSGASPVFVVTFNTPMIVSGIELGKAFIHRIAGQELALRTMLPPGSISTIAISPDEITINLPAVRLTTGSSIPVTGRVYLDFFVNVAAAVAMIPSYEVAPPRADGNFVSVLRVKPAIDPVQLRAAIEASTVLAKVSDVNGVGDLLVALL